MNIARRSVKGHLFPWQNVLCFFVFIDFIGYLSCLTIFLLTKSVLDNRVPSSHYRSLFHSMSKSLLASFHVVGWCSFRMDDLGNDYLVLLAVRATVRIISQSFGSNLLPGIGLFFPLGLLQAFFGFVQFNRFVFGCQQAIMLSSDKAKG